MTPAEQIIACQTPRLYGLDWYADTNERMARDERKTHCATCERWQWRDRQCALFVATEPQPKEPA